MDRETLRAIRSMVAPLERGLMLVASKFTLSLARDSRSMQGAQGTALDSETLDDHEHMQPGGLTHVALPGAEGVFLTVGGARDDGVVICVSNRGNRPKNLASGETALYNASTTQSTVTIRANGDVEVTLATGARLLMGDGTQSFIRGEDFVTYLNAVIAATGTAIAGVPTAGAALKTAFDAAISTAVPLRTAALSTVIKGE